MLFRKLGAVEADSDLIRRMRSNVELQHVEASIVIDAPISDVYQQWVREEEFPKFMSAVREVRRMEGDRFYWRVERGGREYEAISQIILKIPERRIAWRTISGAESSGVVGFDPVPGNKTRILFKMKYVPDAGWDDPSALLERVKARLRNFEKLMASGEQSERTT